MSRIDEALRHASAIAEDPAVATANPAAAAAREGGLEIFPQEDRAFSDGSASLSRPQVARTESRHFRGRHSEEWAGRLVTCQGISEVAVEQYRRLAATVHELQVERGLRTLMVTSALPQDGKTLTAANIALTLSESYGRRVLLVDADLRHPSLGQVFQLPIAPGLGDVLRSVRNELPLHPVTGRLRVLTAGKPDSNPMAALTSDRMRQLLEQAATQFDWVLLDTPPVGVLPDGQLLARLVRAVIFVIGAGYTPYPEVERAIAELGRECIVGTVLNSVDERVIPANRYYRRYYEPEMFNDTA